MQINHGGSSFWEKIVADWRRRPLCNGVFVGEGSTVIQMVNIASDAMIGAHSTIIADVGEKMKANGIIKLAVEKLKREGHGVSFILTIVSSIYCFAEQEAA